MKYFALVPLATVLGVSTAGAANARLAAELAGQWPFRTLVFDQEPAKHLCACATARQLIECGVAVERVQIDAVAGSFRNRGFTFDRVAKRKPRRRDF